MGTITRKKTGSRKSPVKNHHDERGEASSPRRICKCMHMQVDATEPDIKYLGMIMSAIQILSHSKHLMNGQ
jgi:hypothetical protein